MQGVFLVLRCARSTRRTMILRAGGGVRAWGMLDTQAEGQVRWPRWFLAFAPLALPTILASWRTIRWRSPPELLVQPADPTVWHPLWHWACSASVPGAGNGVYHIPA
jgi:di/tricarboxylate transporter